MLYNLLKQTLNVPARREPQHRYAQSPRDLKRLDAD
jgi:hypothetical protein